MPSRLSKLNLVLSTCLGERFGVLCSLEDKVGVLLPLEDQLVESPGPHLNPNTLVLGNEIRGCIL